METVLLPSYPLEELNAVNPESLYWNNPRAQVNQSLPDLSRYKLVNFPRLLFLISELKTPFSDLLMPPNISRKTLSLFVMSKTIFWQTPFPYDSGIKICNFQPSFSSL